MRQAYSNWAPLLFSICACHPCAGVILAQGPSSNCATLRVCLLFSIERVIPAQGSSLRRVPHQIQQRLEIRTYTETGHHLYRDRTSVSPFSKIEKKNKVSSSMALKESINMKRPVNKRSKTPSPRKRNESPSQLFATSHLPIPCSQ